MALLVFRETATHFFIDVAGVSRFNVKVFSLTPVSGGKMKLMLRCFETGCMSQVCLWNLISLSCFVSFQTLFHYCTWNSTFSCLRVATVKVRFKAIEVLTALVCGTLSTTGKPLWCDAVFLRTSTIRPTWK